MSSPTFLPWVRRGLSQSGGAVDTLSGTVARRATVRADVALKDSTGAIETISHERDLLGPADVVAIETDQILRFEPPHGSSDVEINYFPLVEFSASDLPWMLTPADATADGGLRPWLVLIVVEIANVTFDPDGGTAPGVGSLTVPGDVVARELWDLSDSHLWAHVQSASPAEQVGAEVESGSGSVVSRLVCPRKLRKSTAYRAAVVPAFDAGVAAGLGEEIADGDLNPAWDIDGPDDVRVPVYASWTFTTSELAGDFESLAKRLQPDTDGGRIGFQDCELDTGGFLRDQPSGLEWTFEFAGALTDPGQKARPLTKKAADWLGDRLPKALEQGTGRAPIADVQRADYDPASDDPVLAPPMYGRYAAHRDAVPKTGWLRRVNLDVRERAAAGLGAEVVRRGEHDFLAAAWDQTEALREAVVEANRMRLTAEVADRHHERLSHLDDGALLFAVGKTKSFIPQGSTTVARAIANDRVVPTGVISGAFYRAARPGGSIGRAISATSDVSLAGEVAGAFLSASAPTTPSDLGAVEMFTATFVPDGAIVSSTTQSFGTAVLSGEVLADRVASLSPLLSVAVARNSKTVPPAPARATAVATKTVSTVSAAGAVRLAESPALLDLVAEARANRARSILTPSDSADAVRAALPSASVAAGFAARATGFAPSDSVPTKVVVGAWFPDGLSPRLQAISPELLVPGVGDFANDRVRLLEINESFVASLLIGANHEWAREALWREFPADLAATSFASLFDRPGNPPAPGDETDLNDDLHDIAVSRSLASMIGGEGSGTVILIRAELVRRYPGLLVTLMEPDAGNLPITKGGKLQADFVHQPMFVGRLDPSTVFVGFDVDPQTVLDNDWWVSLEQPMTGPRFGLDAAGGQKPNLPAKWTDLSWAHVRGALNTDALGHLRTDDLQWAGTELNGLTWGTNGAHQAAITYQRPFRMIFPAPVLIGGSS